MEKKHRIVIGITGASGAIYAKQLLEKLVLLQDQVLKSGIVFSDNAKEIWEYELNNEDYKKMPFKTYDKNDYNAPFASGSAKFGIMIICPCSMGTLGRIANGISDNLITRAADVILKEKRKLILVTRDSPLSLIHINNMQKIARAGGIICPASPSFYSKPRSIEDLVNTIIDRVLDLAGFEIQTKRWNE